MKRRQTITISDLTQQNVQAITEMKRASEHERTVGERVADIVAATVGGLCLGGASLVGQQEFHSYRAPVYPEDAYIRMPLPASETRSSRTPPGANAACARLSTQSCDS